MTLSQVSTTQLSLASKFELVSLAPEDREKFKDHDQDSFYSGLPRQPKFPYPGFRPQPEQFRTKTPPPTRPKPRPAYKGHQRAADARADPERLVDIYPNDKLLKTILDAYPHPDVKRRKTYQQLAENRGGSPEHIWKGVALVCVSSVSR
jgi:hypothetical protein